MKINNIELETFKNVRNVKLVDSSGKNEFGLTSVANWNLEDFCSNPDKFGRVDFKIAKHQE